MGNLKSSTERPSSQNNQEKTAEILGVSVTHQFQSA